MNYKAIAIAVLFSGPAQAGGVFVYGHLGVGVHDPAFDGPEVTTSNPLGAAGFGVGMDLSETVEIKAGYEHFSSLRGFPDVFDSPGEDGYGFNGLVIKIEARRYIFQ